MSTKVTEILSRFPGPVTLRPSRKKWLLVFAGSALFAAGGYWMIQSNTPTGWLVLIFFGLGALVAPVMMLPGASSLTLDRDGFEVGTFLRRYRARWPDVSRFEVMALRGHKMVVYDDTAQKHAMLAAAAIAMTGHTSGLPDTYLSADDLAGLIAGWRERALAGRPRG